MVRRAKSIRTKLKRDGLCNAVRQYVLNAWNFPHVFNHQQVCVLTMLPCIELFALTTGDVIVMLLRSEDYKFDADIQALCTHYYEFELNSRITVVVTSKNRNTPRAR